MQPANPIPHLSVAPHLHARRLNRRVYGQAHGANAFRGALRSAAARMAGSGGQRGPVPAGTRTQRGSGRVKMPVMLRVNRGGQEKSTLARESGAALALGRAGGDPRAAARNALRARIHRVAERLGVDPMLSEAIARAESGLDPSARSPDGVSKGAFQMKVPTASAMRERLKGEASGMTATDEVVLGVGYLRYLDRLFARRAVLDSQGHTTIPVANAVDRRPFTIAAYNAGEGAVATAQRRARAAGGDPRKFEDVAPFLPAVTQRYVGRVLASVER